MTSNPPYDNPTANRVPIMALVALFILGCFPNAVLLCAPAISNELIHVYHLDASQIGLFFSIEFAGYAVTGIAGTFFLSKFDWAKLVKFAILFFILGNVLSMFVLENFTLFMIIRGLTSILGGCLLNLMGLTFSGASPQSGRAYACYILGQLTFGVVGLFIFPKLFPTMGLSIFFISISIFAVLFVPFIKYLPEKPSQNIVKAERGQLSINLMTIGITTITLFYLGLVGVWTFVGEIGKSINISDQQMGMVLSFATFAGVLGSGVTAVISGRVKSMFITVSGMLIMVISILIFSISTEIILYFIAAFLFKFAWTYVIPIILETVSKADDTGRLLSFASSGIGFGMMIGPLIAGMIITASNGYTAMLIISAVFSALSFGGVLMLNKYTSQTKFD
ncbi:MFS transporter [Acinetobacter bereziniae]|uniref:MFS transporter n=1 Tax=Acinetobacter bereziniae TaxID=106648 RepID=UPI002FDAF7A7